MDLNKYFKAKSGVMDTMATAGTIGLHMVSGPMVGFGIGYALDYWLGTGPWLMLVFLVVGIGAGFLNVYEDSKRLLRRMQAEDDKRRNSPH